MTFSVLVALPLTNAVCLMSGNIVLADHFTSLPIREAYDSERVRFVARAIGRTYVSNTDEYSWTFSNANRVEFW